MVIHAETEIEGEPLCGTKLYASWGKFSDEYTITCKLCLRMLRNEEVATVFAECECGTSWGFRPERGLQSVYEHLIQMHDALPDISENVTLENDEREEWIS